MNKKQFVVMWVTLVLIAVIGIKPPTQREDSRVFKANYIAGKKVDVPRLVGYWVAAGTIGAGAIYTLKDKKPKDD